MPNKRFVGIIFYVFLIFPEYCGNFVYYSHELSPFKTSKIIPIPNITNLRVVTSLLTTQPKSLLSVFKLAEVIV